MWKEYKAIGGRGDTTQKAFSAQRFKSIKEQPHASSCPTASGQAKSRGQGFDVGGYAVITLHISAEK